VGVPSSYSDSNHAKLSVTSLSSDIFQKYAWLIHSCPRIEIKVGRVNTGDKPEHHMMAAKHFLANKYICCICKMVMA
jgi:hypothetical protein